VSIATAIAEAKHLRALLDELGCVQKKPTVIFEDNQGCIFMTKNDMFSKRTKHIDVKWHFAQEAVADGTIAVKYVHTSKMPADCLTKPLAAEKLHKCRDVILRVDNSV
jgi:hypothetical protein